MVDINEIAGLLHVEEKLRQHGEKFKNMLAAVRQKLEEHESEHKPAPAQEAKTEDEMKLEPQPRIPDPDPTVDLAEMNHPPADRIENRRV